MEAQQTPFPAFWYGIDLPSYREIDGTYQRMAYNTAPPSPLDTFQGEFQWLPAEPWSLQDGCGRSQQQQNDWLERFESLVRAATDLSLTLPASFLRYMRGNLIQRVRFSRGGYYRLPDRIVESPKGGGYLFLFLADSQDCLLWYLYLDRSSNDHCVAVSWDYFGCDVSAQPQFPAEPDNVYFTAPSFEAFIYRTWIENEIWFTYHEGRWPLTEAQERYVAHYCQPNDPSDRRPRCGIHDCHLLPGHELWLAPASDWFPKGFLSLDSKCHGSFPRASAYRICSWMRERDFTVVSKAFCPNCRKGMVAFCLENDLQGLLNRLRRHIEIE